MNAPIEVFVDNTALLLAHSKNELMQWQGVRRLSVRLSAQIASSRRQMAGSQPNLHTMVSR